MSSNDVQKGLQGRSQDSNPTSFSKNISPSPPTDPVTRTQRAKEQAVIKQQQQRSRKQSPPGLPPATKSEEKLGISHPLKSRLSDHHSDHHLKKQQQQNLPKPKLSKENLKHLQSQLGSSTQRVKGDTERLGTEFTDSEVQRESTIMTTSTVASATYRYTTMVRANIFVQRLALPANIHLRVNAIFNGQVSVNRASELYDIAKSVTHKMMIHMRTNTQEVDYLKVIVDGLEAMDSEEAFLFSGQCRWDPILQPQAQPLSNSLSTSFARVEEANDELQYTSQRSRKRQHTDSPSDAVFEATAQQTDETGNVKLPCSDYTMGLATSTLAEALSKHGVSVLRATNFLDELEGREGFRPHPSRGPMGYWFPTLVIETKAHSTGRTPFEAENQAAVSACYVIKALQRFADSYIEAVQGSSGPPPPCGRESPLVFSITSCGPLLQLWVHYALMEDNRTLYYMNILKSCHACVVSELEAFLSMVEQLMAWNKKEVLPEVTKQLIKLSQSLGM
ncbi:uncharacterized protein PV06_07024 [Exophiala oligosperma]|uniref:Uncharacterized protein n=1 Tax=Exophiala oligosperma TaxID=215243 RepID=A0A0D2E101_9EURO|nr:uncharacterized protein PV06_07024 [Exophiala oligosperma]KIW41469.1 hypothetical protein PV06_07024 [Exophiala oligosperma]